MTTTIAPSENELTEVPPQNELTEFVDLTPPPLTLAQKVWQWVKPIGMCLWVWSSLSTCSYVKTLSLNRAPALVQTATGDGVPVKQMEPLHRSAEVLRAFTKDWMFLTFNWDNFVDTDGKAIQDKGIKAGTYGKTVPTNVWLGSFALGETLRPAWLNAIQETHDLEPYMRGERGKFMRVEQLNIKQTGQGRYEAHVVATWIDIKGDNKVGQGQPWNKILTLQAIPRPGQPRQLRNKPPAYQTAMFSLLQRGILIVDIKDL